MSEIFNIYCDESCHLESKNVTPDNRFMVLGAISCPVSKKDEIFERIKSIKKAGNMTNLSEMKWTKVAKGKLDIYKDLINYFFDCSDLSFRSVVIDKEQLNHANFNQNHDDFYYKMYWQVLEWFVEPKNAYNIYLDLKDTLGSTKIKNLRNVLCNSHHDFDRKIIERIQEVRSHEIAILQLTDLLIGAISYAKRYPAGGKSEAKNEIVKLIRDRSKVSLQHSTSLGARKFNIFCWEGKK
ncbi:MAG: hypothetical protein ACJAS6_001351 [Rickettsiales bacterium]|jgi:hypothetical protein